jgi:ubiquinone biosynthesis protein Coq4
MYQLIIKARAALLVFLTHTMALPLLQLLRNEQKFKYTLAELLALPEGSLGYQLAKFLRDKNLQLLPYYARHDIKHILLGYDTTGEGEVCLQCFMLGNRHVSIPVIATVLYGFVTMPEHWREFKTAFRRGKKCEPISCWKWFEILEVPLKDLQCKIA